MHNDIHGPDFRKRDLETGMTIFSRKLSTLLIAVAAYSTSVGRSESEPELSASRLAADCRRFGAGLLLPFGCVNPVLPDWREDLRRCAEEHKMRGIRVHPNYHGYALGDPAFRDLLAAATERRMLVQIAVQMQDERTQHPLVRAKAVDIAALPKMPGARVQLLNANRPVAAGVATDFAMVEGVHGLRNLAGALPGRVLFGSYYPCFYFESAVLKLKESGLDRKPIETENALRLLEGGR